MKINLPLFFIFFIVIGCSSNEIDLEINKIETQEDNTKSKITLNNDDQSQNQITDIPNTKTCELSDGELVDDGWSGKDTGSNYCNQCRCINSKLACTRMACVSKNTSNKDSDSDEEQRKKDDEDKKVNNTKPYYEDNCMFKPEIILKVYGDVEDHKIDSVKKAIDELNITDYGIKVPVYILLWEVKGEKGLDKNSAETLKNFIVPKFFPNSSTDDDMVKHVTEDIMNKVQRETITADYYSESCAAAMFIAATNVSDFKNYLGKIVFHEFHHIWDSSFYANSPGGNRETPAWMTEGMAEYDGLIKVMDLNSADQNYFNTTISDIKSKLITNPHYIDLDKDIFSFCDACPVNSIEKGIVVIDYIMNNYVDTDFKTFARKYYTDLNKFGWEQALTNTLGDYDTFKMLFKNRILN